MRQTEQMPSLQPGAMGREVQPVAAAGLALRIRERILDGQAHIRHAELGDDRPVEQLDHPGWRGKPVIVGGDADKHGVVSTASYEARAFGVHSAQPASVARRLCPDAIWTHGHFDRYREMSETIMSILRDETPLVQQVSIDEAFVDVSPTKVNTEHPVRIAERIQSRV